MDQLHLDLWWRGLNIAQDAGTGFYNLEKPWDNPLVTSLVHNTVTVNGQDQMTRSGRFLVLDWANAYSKPVIELDDSILYRREAYFTGYRRFRVNHKRVVTIYKNDFWEIEDRLVNKSWRANNYRLHWLLCDCEWKIQHNEFSTSIDLQTEMGLVNLTIQHPGQAEVQMSLVRAGMLLAGSRDVQPYEGWVSRNYGQKNPALSFALEIRTPSNITLTSQFKLK
jgi:hypothetical protein